MVLYTTKPRAVQDTSVWHTWFAWHPVWVGNDLVWLQRIQRRIIVTWTPGGWEGAESHVTIEYSL